jgi:hypothetical protein
MLASILSHVRSKSYASQLHGIVRVMEGYIVIMVLVEWKVNITARSARSIVQHQLLPFASGIKSLEDVWNL